MSAVEDDTPVCPVHDVRCRWSDDATPPERFGHDPTTALNDGIWWCPGDDCTFQVESRGPEWFV